VPRYTQLRTTIGWAPGGTKEYASYQQRKPDIDHGFAGYPRNLQPGRLDLPEGVEQDKNRRAISSECGNRVLGIVEKSPSSAKIPCDKSTPFFVNSSALIPASCVDYETYSAS
jgi:hypothetical protein